MKNRTREICTSGSAKKFTSITNRFFPSIRILHPLNVLGRYTERSSGLIYTELMGRMDVKHNGT